MGKQFEFFITEMDEIEFLTSIIESDDKIINDNLCEFTIDDVLKSEEISLYIFFPESKIIKSPKGFVDIICSEGIHYSRAFKHDSKVVGKSRMWLEMKYYDEDKQLVTKGKWLDERFKKYKKWIRKNCKISKCKHYYIGKYAYKLYKEQGYVMKAGPKYFAEFD